MKNIPIIIDQVSAHDFLASVARLSPIDQAEFLLELPGNAEVIVEKDGIALNIRGEYYAQVTDMTSFKTMQFIHSGEYGTGNTISFRLLCPLILI